MIEEDAVARHFDNTQAFSEGWAIAECPGWEDGDWQLQKLDQANVFEDDKAAWAFVAARARDGSKYHQSAITFLRVHNPVEAEKVTKQVQIE